MSIWEWMFERRNPGPIGNIDTQKSEFNSEDIPGWKRVLFFCIGVVFWAIATYFFLFSVDKGLVFDMVAILVIYLIISWLLHPKPNRRNMGWAGGLIDNPFRWSDDINRMLFFFQLILWPGKLMLFCIPIIRFWLRKK